METKNPYSDLVAMMQSQGTRYNPPYIRIGQVVHPLPAILVKLDDLQLDAEDLLLSETLLDHTRKAALKESAAGGRTGSVPVGDHGSHFHSIDQIGFTEGELSFRNCLQKGDLVGLLPLDHQQKYIVLCKVVNPNG